MIRDLHIRDSRSNAMMSNVRRPIVLSDAADVIGSWAKLYRFGGPALN
ncbi:MAG: hypothetical protein GIX03_07020 [Candidatus Eremiobacteraeota bacterium]|nr:hypothetical protein [Candidatus Eremiobacteraeota bacterium]MBC5802744.1 hypothetical protein [Candidatus Eremiobacteraeota bacterium]MBC5820735.1 hypothetical protein [Candidatus Eremiobacteraeota bacterium]